MPVSMLPYTLDFSRMAYLNCVLRNRRNNEQRRRGKGRMEWRPRRKLIDPEARQAAYIARRKRYLIETGKIDQFRKEFPNG